MAEDFGPTKKTKRQKTKKKLDDDFDAEWDKYKAKEPEKPKEEIKPKEKPKPKLNPKKKSKKEIKIKSPPPTTTEDNDADTDDTDELFSYNKEERDKDREKQYGKKKAVKKKAKNNRRAKSTYADPKTRNDLEYGMSEAVLKQRAETKRIQEKRRREFQAKIGLLDSKKDKGDKTKDGAKSESTTTLKVDNNTKGKQHKRKSSKIRPTQSQPPSPNLKPTKLTKSKSARLGKIAHSKKKSGDDIGDKSNNLKLADSKISDGDTMEMSALKEENNDLKRELRMNQFVRKKYEILKNEASLDKQKIQVLTEENEVLRQEMNALKKKYDALNATMNEIKRNEVKKQNVVRYDHEVPIDTNSDTESDEDEPKKVQKKQDKVAVSKNNGSHKMVKKKEDTDSDSSDSDSDDEYGGNMKKSGASKKDEITNGNDKDKGVEHEDVPDPFGQEQSFATDSDEELNGDDFKLGINEWEEWEADQICDWIIGLDAKYKKWEKAVRKELNEEEMHGSLLSELDETDFERFGIKSVKHQKAIMMELKKMTGQSVQEIE